MDVPRDTSEGAVVAAIAGNWLAYLRTFDRAPHVEVSDDRELFLFVTGIPSGQFNAVMRADLPPGALDATLDEVRARFATRGVPWSWLVGPDTRPTDLGRRLAERGMTHIGQVPCMAADLLAVHPLQDEAPPAGLTIARVDDEATLRQWIATEAVGFEIPDGEAAGVAALRMGMGRGDDVSPRRYLGLVDGAPVATASLLLGSGAAGVYDVSTIPTSRRRGVGTALTGALMREARAIGYRVAILQSSTEGAGVYRRLGFRDYCSYDIYV